jgi:hypothetical protein
VAFGIDSLRRYLERSIVNIDAVLASQLRALTRLESAAASMATRADFDALKATLKADIQTIVQSVADLKAQLAAGDPITDQDLQDLQDDVNTLTGQPAPTPTPTPAP